MRRPSQRQAGYMLLMLMLAVAVMSIMALRVAQSYRHRIQRDREVEMIHRGVQYARAVKRYYHQFNVYPTSIDQLEETNKIRFLRKRYKDPMTADGKWKIAHLSDIKLPGVQGLMSPALKSPTATAGTPALTGSLQTGGQKKATGIFSDSTSNTEENKQGKDKAGEGAPAESGSASAEESKESSDSSSSVFGGAVLGPMLGVMSKSHRKGIHSFNDKSRYNEWYFIYAPAQDYGQLITGPFNPSLTGMAVSGSSGPGKKGETTSPTTPTPPGGAAGSTLSTPHP